MQNILKRKIANILETDYNSTDIDDCFLILEDKFVDKKEITTNEVEEQAQDFFLDNINSFIENFNPIYQEMKGVSA